MARPRMKIDTMGHAPELIEKLKTQKPGWERERLLALKLALEGNKLQQVGESVGRSERTVSSWIKKFRTGGLDGLLEKGKGNGPQSELTDEMRAGMTEQLKLGKWRTARDAWNWLSENHDVSHLKESVIYKYLGKCEGRLKATRP